MKKDRACSMVKAGIAAVLLSSPTPLVAGGYGSSAVADSQVSNQTAAQGTVWCERLDASVTESLFRQMDCGSGSAGFASPAVAGERVTNRRSGGSIFQRFPHTRGVATVTSGDSDSDMLTNVSSNPTGDPSTDDPSTGDPTTGDPTADDPQDPGTPTTDEPDKPKKDKKKKDKKKDKKKSPKDKKKSKGDSKKSSKDKKTDF